MGLNRRELIQRAAAGLGALVLGVRNPSDVIAARHKNPERIKLITLEQATQEINALAEQFIFDHLNPEILQYGVAFNRIMPEDIERDRRVGFTGRMEGKIFQKNSGSDDERHQPLKLRVSLDHGGEILATSLTILGSDSPLAEFQDTFLAGTPILNSENMTSVAERAFYTGFPITWGKLTRNSFHPERNQVSIQGEFLPPGRYHGTVRADSNDGAHSVQLVIFKSPLNRVQ